MTGVLKHIGLVHANEPNFNVSCGIQGCPRTYKNYYSFRKHLQRRHQDCLVSKPFSNPSLGLSTDCVDGMTDLQQLGMTNKEDTPESQVNITKNHNPALFILKTKEVLNLSQSATNIILNDVAEIVQQTVIKLEARVSCVLSSNSIDRNEVIGLNEVFQDQTLLDPFYGLHSEYIQQKYYQDHFMIVVCY